MSFRRELVTRYGHNPILTKHDVPYVVETVHNAAVIKASHRYVMLFRSHVRSGRSILGAAESDDGLSFAVCRHPFRTPATDGVFQAWDEEGVQAPGTTSCGVR